MSEDVSQTELENLILGEFYRYAQKGTKELTFDDVHRMLGGSFGLRRVELAVRALAEAGLLEGSHFMNSPSTYLISDAGYKKVENSIFERVAAAGAEKVETDPILSLENRLAPASGRMVSFGDNQHAREQVIECVHQAEEILRSSNTLEEGVREDALAYLSAWRKLVETAKNFAVGAFRFMVWDRLRKVIEKGLEDAYRAALVGILITLGTIIVGLL
jgi:hypothetical protein